MTRHLGNPEAVQALAQRLDAARLKRGLTLEELSRATAIHKGQLSRFCNGQFVRTSPNLLRFCNFLQIDPQPYFSAQRFPESIANQVSALWNRSAQHQEALQDMLRALSRLL